MWAATAIISSIGASLLQRNDAKKAKKRAAKKALEDDKQARKAEIFAETEGEGIGQLAQVSMEVDDEEEEEIKSSTVRI